MECKRQEKPLKIDVSVLPSLTNGEIAPPSRAPICQQPAAVEEAWWARVFAERALPDPAHVSPAEFRAAVARRDGEGA